MSAEKRKNDEKINEKQNERKRAVSGYTSAK